MAQVDAKMMLDDVRARDTALLNLLLTNDRQAIDLFRINVTIGSATAVAAASGFLQPESLVQTTRWATLTISIIWPGATATSKYAIDLRPAEAASAIAANRRLPELVAGLDAMSPIGTNLTNAADAQSALSTLGLSAFVRSLMDETDCDTFLTALNALRAFRNQSLLEIAHAIAEATSARSTCMAALANRQG
jgi:hypothetical protein